MQVSRTHTHTHTITHANAQISSIQDQEFSKDGFYVVEDVHIVIFVYIYIYENIPSCKRTCLAAIYSDKRDISGARARFSREGFSLSGNSQKMPRDFLPLRRGLETARLCAAERFYDGQNDGLFFRAGALITTSSVEG